MILNETKLFIIFLARHMSVKVFFFVLFTTTSRQNKMLQYANRSRNIELNFGLKKKETRGGGGRSLGEERKKGKKSKAAIINKFSNV